MSTDIRIWGCTEARANYDPDIVQGGILYLYIYGKDGRREAELILEGLPARQAEAIAAACTPCDCVGWTEQEAAPLRRLRLAVPPGIGSDDILPPGAA